MRVLITGCSTGFGRGTARELTERGHEVIATARQPKAIDDLDVAQKLALDVSSDDSVRAAFADAGRVDALVNNAGIGFTGPVERLPIAEGRRLMETNLFGALRTIQAVLPGMREQGNGTIVNVSSVAGRVAPPFDGFYSATKFALEGLTEALKYEVNHFGIKVALIEPGYFETAFGDNAGRVGRDEAPYDQLDREWEAASQVLRSSDENPDSHAVARAIADVIEAEDPPFRTPVGSDAELVTGARASMSDAEFERAMRSTLGIEW
ncbi:MAG TPA: SDR family oxidoreductase [Acidimicrobiia bacterium]|jgi:NAD(P)-dependent dehydrogenase (short-subunit alcohol dehydrogenase family)